MFTPDNHIKQADFANLTDYKAARPEGKLEFYSFVRFTDCSEAMWDKIFAASRAEALQMVNDRFADCANYIHSISLALSN